MITGAAWEALVARIAALRGLVLDAAPADPAVRADGLRYLLDFLSAGLTVCVQHDDTDLPELGHMIHHRATWGLDNPDCLYSYTRLRGDGTYRLRGQLGSARHLELQVNTGHHSDGNFMGWQAVSALAGDDIAADGDGRFEIVLGAQGQGPNPMRLDHRASFFAFLAARAGGPIWIERSGSSLSYLGSLAALFPRARFVHIHRDGHEAALSMREHPFFRLGVTLLLGLLPEGLDPEAAITHAIETPPPCWAVGRYWSDQVLRGFRAVPELDRDQLLQVRFEDLLARPAETLEAIAAFFALPPDPGFAERAAGFVRGAPASRLEELNAAEWNELRQACRPGQVLLGRSE